MKILKWIFVSVAAASGSSFENCKRHVLRDLNSLVDSGLPSPQQALLVKQTRHVVYRLAESQECRSIEALLHFTHDMFNTLNNRQLTLLNEIIHHELRKASKKPEELVLELAHKAKFDLDVNMLQYPGFFEDFGKQDAIARIYAVQALYTHKPVNHCEWFIDADTEELVQAARTIELTGETVARVSEEHQVSVLKTFRGTASSSMPNGKTKAERMQNMARQEELVRDPVTSDIAVRWARLIARPESHPFTHHPRALSTFFGYANPAWTSDRYLRVTEMFESLAGFQGEMPGDLMDVARDAFMMAMDEQTGDWSERVDVVMSVLATGPVLPPVIPEVTTTHSFTRLALIDELNRDATEPALFYPEVDPQLGHIFRALVVGAVDRMETRADEARLLRMAPLLLSRRARSNTDLWNKVMDRVVDFASKLGHRVLVDQVDTVKATFPALTDGAIAHLRVIVASLMAVSAQDSVGEIIKGAMTEEELAPIRHAMEGLAKAYRQFHQEGNQFIEFLPLSILRRTYSPALVNEWLAMNPGITVYRSSALRGPVAELRSVINDWNLPVTDSQIALEDFLATHEFISVLTRSGLESYITLGFELPSLIYLSERYQANPADQAVRLAKRKSVSVYIDMVKTLYRHPLKKSDFRVQSALNRLFSAIRGKLYSNPRGPVDNTDVAEEYEAIYAEIAKVLRKIRGEPEPTSTTTAATDM